CKYFKNIVNNNHVNSAPTLSIFFLLFPDFQGIFELLTIFGNLHRPCKHYSDIVTNSVHYVSSFFQIFWLITIFGNVSGGGHG
ncbi:hypothetical protein K443DRAFT_97522, partial [Laccaria amethystina LaAM-08-1]